MKFIMYAYKTVILLYGLISTCQSLVGWLSVLSRDGRFAYSVLMLDGRSHVNLLPMCFAPFVSRYLYVTTAECILYKHTVSTPSNLNVPIVILLTAATCIYSNVSVRVDSVNLWRRCERFEAFCRRESGLHCRQFISTLMITTVLRKIAATIIKF